MIDLIYSKVFLPMWFQKVLEGHFVSRETINYVFEPNEYIENGSQQFTKSILILKVFGVMVVITEACP